MNLRSGEGCLLLLDGFDEFPAEFLRESIIKRIICGEVLGKLLLVITTRSNAAKDLRDICSRGTCQYLKILRFTIQQIDDYILSAFQTTTSQNEFQKHLHLYPNIRSFMCLPLHCALVEIYKSQQSKKEVPKTMTELYTEIVKVLIVRSLQSDATTDFQKVQQSLVKFSDLPTDYHKYFKELSEMAYNLAFTDKPIEFPTHLKSLGMCR